AIRERERLAAEAAANGGVFPMTGGPGDGADGTVPGTPAAQATIEPEDQISVVVQFATPDPSTFDAALTNMRAVPGVRSLSVTSTAMGGTSVMNVTYRGDVGALAGALRDRGFAVRESGDTLSISR
ncbi:MAG: heavy-metal-associated domain-containing protein, partial [Pseudomonadota bacterium]